MGLIFDHVLPSHNLSRVVQFSYITYGIHTHMKISLWEISDIWHDVEKVKTLFHDRLWQVHNVYLIN